MEINTSITIQADRPTVWGTLTHFEGYPRWNRFMTRIEGKKHVGAILIVDIVLPGSKKATFKPTIIKYDANVEMRWVGILGTPWLFRGEHYFKLEKIDEKNTRLIHGEIFSGLLAPIFSALGDKKTLNGFNLMNDGLKTETEKSAVEFV
jgi:hypothetical protein